MARHGTTPEQMAVVAVRNRANARANPLAHKPMRIAVADVLASPMVASPYRRLDCSFSLGELSPYFEGLIAGRAVASTCVACGRTWFPPRLGCCSRAGPARWKTLAGTGRIAAGTNGGGTLPFGGGSAGEGLALVALDGADNLALGWVDGLGDVPPVGARVRLVATESNPPHPAQATRYVPE